MEIWQKYRYLNEDFRLTFSDVFSENLSGIADVNVFKAEYSELMPIINDTLSIDDKYISMTFYLLYSKYAQCKSMLATKEVLQFKLSLFKTMADNVTAWIKKRELSSTINTKDIDDEALTKGDTLYNNTSLNNTGDPVESDTESVEYINNQTRSTVKKNLINSYNTLWDNLSSDIDEEYILKFKHLFDKNQGVSLYNPTYESDEEV